MGLFFFDHLLNQIAFFRDFLIRAVDRISYKMFDIIYGLFNASFDRLLLHKGWSVCQLFSATFGKKSILHSGTSYKCRSLPRMVGSLGQSRWRWTSSGTSLVVSGDPSSRGRRPSVLQSLKEIFFWSWKLLIKPAYKNNMLPQTTLMFIKWLTS